MLIARGAKRDRTTRFLNDMRYDIVDGEQVIGLLVYDRHHGRADLTLRDAAFTLGRVSDRPDETAFQALLRLATGSEKPPANPYALSDAAGITLALAERTRKGFMVGHRGDSFVFRKGTSRPFSLYHAGSDEPLGRVGQEHFWTRRLILDLPPPFEAPFQAFLLFLLFLLLELTMEHLEAAGGSSL